MSGHGRGGRYHHGDLRAALIDVALELIAERGTRNFSLAEASRRLGVAASAPYAHFTDREALLAAVAVQAYESFTEVLRPACDEFEQPTDRLVGMTRAYVRFAASHPPLFEVIYGVEFDKSRHPEIETAAAPVNNMFLECVRAVCEEDEVLIEELAAAVETAALGHALSLLVGGSTGNAAAVTLAVERAARITLALIDSRDTLRGPAVPDAQPQRSLAPPDGTIKEGGHA